MAGVFRNEQYYINKFGDIDGSKKYKIMIKRREAKQRRNIAATSLVKKEYTTDDVINGRAIKCEECGYVSTRLQWSHFKYKCLGNIVNINEYKIKYPTAKIICEELSDNIGITLNNLIRLYGETEGHIKWKQYCDKQAETNTLEYKSKKYGWSKENFEIYNKSRSMILEKCIERYGEAKGLIIWKNYCDKQRETCTLEYFISKWGEDEGSNRYYNWMKSWVSNGKAEKQIFQELQKILPHVEFKQQIRLHRNTMIKDRRFGYFYDFGSVSDKKLIEFNGTIWHADPRRYKENDVLPNKEFAKDIWEKDRIKISTAISQGFKVFLIWQDDWITDRDKILNNLLRWWNGN